MFNVLKVFFVKILNLLERNPTKDIKIPMEIQGSHDCGLRALHIVLPSISIEKMKDAFTNCCEWWPYKGISNKEFNISLSYLKIKNKFDYVAPQSTSLSDLMYCKKDIFIALIHGHYTVVKK